MIRSAAWIDKERTMRWLKKLFGIKTEKGWKLTCPSCRKTYVLEFVREVGDRVIPCPHCSHVFQMDRHGKYQS